MEYVQKAVNGTPGSPDWSTVLTIVSMVEQTPSRIPDLISAICRILQDGAHGKQLNALILLDALFKNCKKPCLTHLQSKQLTNTLDTYQISEDPEMHNYLFKCTPAWIKTCAQNDCLDSTFSEWQESYCNTYFIPHLSGHIKKKLVKDLKGATEILNMFTECLEAAAASQENESSLLIEILQNVREVTVRLVELEPTILDKNLKLVVQTVHAFADACTAAEACYRQTKTFDKDALKSARKAANAKLSRGSRDKVGMAPVERRTPVKKAGENQTDDDISDQEFFEQLARIKTGAPAIATSVAPSAGDDLLLDFGGPATPQPAAAPKPADSLIDSLLEI